MDNSQITKFKPEDHYFKVNSKILEIFNTKDLKKSELLVYLHHCRAANPKGRFLNCSVAGINALSKNLKLERDVIDSATESLIKKYFIEKRTDVKTGYYKTTPIKILPFPDYKLKSNSEGIYSPVEAFDNSSCIKLPSNIIDDQILNSELDRQLIFSILYLYSIIDWINYWGVNYKLIRLENNYNNSYYSPKTFGEGFKKNLFNKPIYELYENNLQIKLSEQNNFKHGNLENNVKKVDIFIELCRQKEKIMVK